MAFLAAWSVSSFERPAGEEKGDSLEEVLEYLSSPELTPMHPDPHPEASQGGGASAGSRAAR